MLTLKISAARARRDLKREIWANVGQWGNELPKFMTFTTSVENSTSELRIANYHLKKFMQRLSYFVGHKIHYSAIPEFQKRGAVHHHVLFYDLPFIDASKLAEIWGRGFIRINAIRDIDAVAVYVSSYMGKDMQGEQDPRFWAQKRHFGSRDLKQAIETHYSSLDDLQEIAGQKPVFEAEYKIEETGTFVTYERYEIDEHEGTGLDTKKGGEYEPEKPQEHTEPRSD